MVTDGQEAFELVGGATRPFPLNEVGRFLDVERGFAYYRDFVDDRIFLLTRDSEESARYRGLEVQVLVHTMFHTFYQHTWNLAPVRQEVGPLPYPFETEPRAYRHAMYTALRRALLNPAGRPQALAEAAHFYQVWQERFPDDARVGRWGDVLEGPATYFEHRALLPVQPTLQEIRELVEGDRWSLNLAPGSHAEGYALGFFVGMLLETEGPAGWHGQVAEGRSPLELLLAGREPRATELPAESLAFAERHAEFLGSMARYMDRTIDLWRAGAPALQFVGGAAGNLSAGPFRSEEISLFALAPFSRLLLNTPAGELEFEHTVALSRLSSVLWLLLAPEQLREENGRVYYLHPTAGRLELERLSLESEQAGRPVYTLRAP